MSFFLYEFIDSNENIIYIGRTNDIRRRILKEHFSDNTHLPSECYIDTARVEYTEIVNESEEVAYEAILINQCRPKYNTQFKDDGEFEIDIPEFIWKEFEWEYEGQLAWLKMKKKGVINANDAILNHIYREGVQGALTGIRDVDAGMILSNQSFTLVAGVSGTKKTDYLLGIARYNAVQGKSVLYINLKNSAEDLAIRLLSIGSRVPVRNILLNQMTEEDWNRITQSLSAGKDNEILFYNSNNDYLQLSKILDEIKNVNADLIIIDDLQMIEDERNHYIKDRMDYVLKSIKAIGVQIATPVIGAYCMPSKKPESRPDHRPQLADMEYNSLLTYPDNIQLLYWDEMYNPDSEQKNIEEIIVVKNLLGNLFTANVAVVGNMFANIEHNS